MRFVSLGEGSGYSANFGGALRQGLAPDGSLYYPQDIPRLDNSALTALRGSSSQDASRIMLESWLLDEMSAVDIAGVVSRAATFDTPVRQVGDKQILELFHGPTMAFKDVAARFLAELTGYYNRRDGRASRVLVATSGDTGGAIAHGFADVPGVTVTILFPKGRVSKLQYEQLTRTADNVSALEVGGTFDDCQRLVVQALGDPALARLGLSSANSINIGRLIPQTIYYANAWGQLPPATKARFVVPTGNLGNLCAGVVAHEMGVPISSFLAANNSNDSLTRYLASGVYEPRDTERTLSNAMDVGRPNNMPRLMRLFGGSVERARQLVQAVSVSDQETVAAIKKVYRDYGYLLDPHTAVAWVASEKIKKDGDATDVIVATASPVKFGDEIKAATGIDVPNSTELEALKGHPRHVRPIGNSYDELKSYLLEAA